MPIHRREQYIVPVTRAYFLAHSFRAMNASLLSPWLCKSGLLIVLFSGCGGSDVERLTVSGSVTYRDQPVPSGIISFTPDAAQGSRGPQGIARIVDGRYTTDDHGKGSVRGKQVVEIRGYGAPGGSGRGDSLPFMSGKPLFPPYRTRIDVLDENATFDFEVPDKQAASVRTR